MFRMIWRRKAVIVTAVLVFFLLVDTFILMEKTRQEGEPTSRQILQFTGGKAVRNEPAVEGSKGVAVGNGGGAAAAAAPTAPNAVVIKLDQLEKKHEIPPHPVVPVSLSLPSGSPKLMGSFPESDPGNTGINHYLPHLKGNPSLLMPGMALSKGKSNVSIVIGIPSIRRPMSTYLYDTIQSLLSGMTPAEKADTLILVCVTEPWNTTYTDEVKREFQRRYPVELQQGLLELIVPKAGFYPNLDNLPPTLGDNPTRVKWRTKQNLDYAFLMLHASSRGQYYLQLEDDVQSTKGFITSIKNAIATNHGDWFILEFSTLGFIGRLFHSQTVPNMVEFLLMFHTQKPCDWLMEDYLQVRMCGHGEKWAKCLYKIRNISRPIRPSLFQHLGLRSSLQGKVNKLKDKHFSSANNSSVFITSNPPVANIYTSLVTYANDIYDAYTGERIFWATIPKEGDVVELMYHPPVTLKKLLVMTGDEKHKTDILTDAVVEVLPATPLSRNSQPARKAAEGPVNRKVRQKSWEERVGTIPEIRTWAKTADQCETGFIEVGKFGATGQVDLDMSRQAGVGPVWSIRVRVLSTSKTWLIVKTIRLTVEKDL